MLMDLLVNSDQFLCDEHHQKVHLIGPTLTGKYPIEITLNLLADKFNIIERNSIFKHEKCFIIPYLHWIHLAQ